MSPGIRNTVISSLVIVGVALALTVWFTTREPTLSDAALRDLGVYVLPVPHDVAAFTLQDQHGAPFDNASFDGRWSFIFFGFTHCPDICPVAMSALAQVERQLAEDDARALHDAFHGVMVTVDPQRDDAETMARYVAAFSPRFTGVIGTRAELAQLARSLNAAFAAVPDPESDDPAAYVVDHTVNIAVVDPRGRYYAFIAPPFDADAIERAYRSLARRG
jgi:protein SCO1